MKDLTSSVDHKLAKKFKEASKKKVSIDDFMRDFINHFLSEQTKRAYLRDLNDFFEFLKSGDVTILHPSDIKGIHFQFYRDKLVDENKASATINRKLVAIRSFIKWSMGQKLIDFNPLDSVKLPKVQTVAPTLAFDDEEVLMIINATDRTTKKGSMHRLSLIMLFSLGLRRSELANIKLKDIYQERGHYILEIRGKGNKTRILPLSESIINALKEYSDSMKSHGINFENEDYLIQSSSKGKNSSPIDGSTIYRMIEKYAKICGINKRVSPHSCRATAISHLLDTQKSPIRDVAIFAGHSQITTTQRYDKRINSLENSAAYSIDYEKKSS